VTQTTLPCNCLSASLFLSQTKKSTRTFVVAHVSRHFRTLFFLLITRIQLLTNKKQKQQQTKCKGNKEQYNTAFFFQQPRQREWRTTDDRNDNKRKWHQCNKSTTRSMGNEQRIACRTKTERLVLPCLLFPICCYYCPIFDPYHDGSLGFTQLFLYPIKNTSTRMGGCSRPYLIPFLVLLSDHWWDDISTEERSDAWLDPVPKTRL